jgi:Domain of unknown function (DUF5060)
MSQKRVWPLARIGDRARFAAIAVALALSGFPSSQCGAQEANTTPAASIEQWGLFDVELHGPRTGNPFVDTQLTATFEQGDTKQTVSGFYDGDGIYRV